MITVARTLPGLGTDAEDTVAMERENALLPFTFEGLQLGSQTDQEWYNSYAWDWPGWRQLKFVDVDEASPPKGSWDCHTLPAEKWSAH